MLSSACKESTRWVLTYLFFPALTACGSANVATVGNAGQANFDPGAAGDPYTVWGTTGNGGSLVPAAGEALCDRDDVRIDDMGLIAAKPTPSGKFGTQVVSDRVGECGNAVETMSWRLLNCERLSRELNPLRCDLRLVYAGRRHSEDMRENGYIAHTNPDGETLAQRLEREGVDSMWNGENISYSTDRASDTAIDIAESSHHGLMNSTGHRANILTIEANFMGPGLARGNTSYSDFPGQWITQIFAY